MQNPYPVNLNLVNKSVVVVGGGKVAARKINSLLASNARVTVVSPQLDPKIDCLSVYWIRRKYRVGDLKNATLIIACTDDRQVNQQVVKDADQFQWVNNVSDKLQSDFYNVAKLENKELLITVSTKGRSPATSKKIKQYLLEWLTQNHYFREDRQ
ncbi:bifunctional precorrin-2 dehydrogenase/sirohydrochlorin ferrochelatase [Lentilactobacillus raoultii]|uniref:precorrin-2 dehydrogenase n=1 Tax=Lentilactobacillus raoultii TaxID=1987503 RepID=A0ABW3PNN3_9LACO|nr:NAD(P)-dependent oxidoreductase [Lentilactobacillus raoultii]